ncbi:hypothetical protein AAMO2058_001536500 [Amorphochlora amoebiformis]
MGKRITWLLSLGAVATILCRLTLRSRLKIARPSVNRSRGTVPGVYRRGDIMQTRARAASPTTADGPKVVVCIADGSEEIETSGIYDTLIRGGVNAILAKVGGGDLKCKMSRGMTFVADTHLEDFKDNNCDMVVLPGGLPGAQAFANSPKLLSMLKDRKEKGEWYAAICASPAVVLEPNGLLPKSATCFPKLQEKIIGSISNDPSSRVVIDNESRVVTSQGPGTTLEFSVELLRILVGEEEANKVAEGLLIKSSL